MKKAFAILLAGVIAVLPAGPGVSRAAAQVVAYAGSAMGTAGPGAAGAGTLRGSARVAGTRGSGFIIPTIRLDATLKPVDTAAVFTRTAVTASVPTLPVSVTGAKSLAMPGVGVVENTRTVEEVENREARHTAVDKALEAVGRGLAPDKKTGASRASSTFRDIARWRNFFDGAQRRTREAVFAAGTSFMGRSPLARLQPAAAIDEAKSVPADGDRRVQWAAGDMRVSVGKGGSESYEVLSKPAWSIDRLAPPALAGWKKPADYRVKKSIKRRRALYLTAHYGLLAAALGAMMIGTALAPFAGAAALLATDIIWQEQVYGRGDDGAYAFDTELMGRDADAYRAYISESLRRLVVRLGADAAETPRVQVSNKRGKAGAAMGGRAIDKDAALTIGEGYAAFAPEQTTAVLAHELGHLANGDTGKLRLLRNRFGYLFGMELVTKLATYGLLLHIASAAVAPHGFMLPFISGVLGFLGFVTVQPRASRVLMRWRERFRDFYGDKRWSLSTYSALGAAVWLVRQFLSGSWMLQTDPASFAVGLLWVAGAVLAAGAGLLSGIAVSRQEELRADHFAGWLTDPKWLADYFRAERSPQSGGRWQRVKQRLFSTHPDRDRRIRELEKPS